MAAQVLRALDQTQLDSVKQVMVAEKVVDFDKVVAAAAAAAAAVEENLQVEDLLTNLVFSPLGRELHLVRQVAQAEQDLHNTAAEAAVAQARQELEDQEVLEEQAAQEFKMLFKQVQINMSAGQGGQGGGGNGSVQNGQGTAPSATGFGSGGGGNGGQNRTGGSGSAGIVVVRYPL